MELQHITVLHGPNRWANVPVFEVLVDTAGSGAFEWKGEAFVRRLRQGLPAEAATPNLDSVAPAQCLAVVTRELQRSVGVECSVAETHPISANRCWVIVEFEEERLARACLNTARQLMEVAARGEPWDTPVELRKLADLADDVRLGPSTMAIVRAAVARGIPFRQLTSAMLVRLGEGVRQRRIWTAQTDRTSAIGADIASDKEMTRLVLSSVGVPVPEGRVVRTVDDAWAAANEIGAPVTIKPRNANHSRGITLEARTREEVEVGFAAAAQETDTGGVIVERFAYGLSWRLLVVGDQMVAAMKESRRSVVGDGRRTLRDLIDETNRDPGRGENYSDLLDPIDVSDLTLHWLARQGYNLDSVPASAAEVVVQMIGDMTTDVTDLVHPRNVRHAIMAAKVVGLDIAGIDVVAEDIGLPLEDQGGVFVEVNAGPSLRMHLDPQEGKPRPVGEAIVSLMFQPGENGRIPVVVVTGGGNRAQTANVLGRHLLTETHHVGLATSDGLFFDGDRLPTAAKTDRARADAVLLHPEVDIAIVESTPDEALASGLPVPRCDLLIVTELPLAPGETPLEALPGSPGAVLAAALAGMRALATDGIALLPAGPPATYLASICRSRVVCFGVDGSREIRSLVESQVDTLVLRGNRVVWVSGGTESIFELPDNVRDAPVNDRMAAGVAIWAARQIAK